MCFTSNETTKLCLSFLPYKISFRRDSVNKIKTRADNIVYYTPTWI